MNAYIHSKLSVKRLGGKIEDYYPIHSFIDSTKELCSDNRHRILHNLWGIRRVIIPIFGSTITNSENKLVNVKDLCEKDHILPDFGNKFIPTLEDFINAITEPNKLILSDLDKFHEQFLFDNEIIDLLLSPLTLTGNIKSLYLTHNSWFINSIVCKIFKIKPIISNFPFSPSQIFKNMAFEMWMDNGTCYPKSKANTESVYERKTIHN